MDLKARVIKECQTRGIFQVGFAPVSRWHEPLFHPWIPEEFCPDAIVPGTRTVIVIGLSIQLPVLETSPSIWYRELYKTVNTLLDQYTYQISSTLCDLGYQAVFVPRDGYGGIDVLQKNPVAFFSHRHAAVLAGLGAFGMNNMVLTQEYGPRVRFGSIFTNAEISPDPVLSDELCIRCNQCVHRCPVHALEEGEYPETLTNKFACAAQSAELNRRYISPCGICIKVCPIGLDREQFQREDIGIYGEKGEGSPLESAWKHVRRYGGR